MEAHEQTDDPDEVKEVWISHFGEEDADDMFVRG
jgi:hypothetical protein